MSSESTNADTSGGSLSRARIVLLLQGMALLIGLAMPVTPSKTGSDGSLAEWFVDDPSYLDEVFVYYVLTNILLGFMLLIAWVWERLARIAEGATGDADSGASSV